MRARSRLLSVAVLTTLTSAGAAACTPQPTVAPAGDGEEASADPPGPFEPTQPINREEGDALDVVLPTIDGSGVAITTLRGKVVVLEFSASWDPSWNEAHAFLARLHQAHAEEDIELFVVALDPEQHTLVSAEQSLDGIATVGWDPQGGLAAKLTVAGFPTYVVVGRKGRIKAVERGFDADVAERLESAVAAAIQSPP